MTKLVHVAGAACAMSLVVSLASAQSLTPQVGREGPKSFFGTACIISASAPACENNGFKLGECGSARYAPRDIAGNPNSTGLSIFWQDYTSHILGVGSIVGQQFRNVQISAIGSGWISYGAEARIVAQTPVNVATAQTAVVTMDVNGFQGLCNVRLRFLGQRRP